MLKIKCFFKVKFGLLLMPNLISVINVYLQILQLYIILYDFSLELQTHWTKTENYFNVLKMIIFGNLITR